MKSILFAILALGLCLAHTAHAGNLYIPKSYSLPEGVDSYTPSQVDDVLARIVGAAPSDEANYPVLPISNEFSSIVGAGPNAVSTVVLLLPSGSPHSEALSKISTSAPIRGNYFSSEKKSNRMSATILSQARGIFDQFEEMLEIAARRKNIAESIKTLQTRCNVANDVTLTLDGKIAYNGIPLFSADSEQVEKVFQELANICVFVADELSRPSTDLTVIDALFDMFDFGLTEEQKQALSDQKNKLIEMLIEAAKKGNITLVGIELDDVISVIRPRRDVIAEGAASASASASAAADTSSSSSSSSEEKKKKNKYGLLPAAKDLPQKQIFIWTGILLVVTMAVVFVMMLGVGVDCERDTLLSRMVSL